MKYKKDSWISTDLINWIKKSISCWAENLVVHEIEHNLQSTYLQSTYLNGTEGLDTLLDLETMKKKQPLEFGSSLSNIDFFLDKTILLLRLEMAKYATSSILETLVRFLSLSQNKDRWEEKRVKSSGSKTMDDSQLKKT